MTCLLFSHVRPHRQSVSVALDGWNGDSPSAGQRESNARLVVGTLIYKKRIEWLFPFIAQGFPREREEQRIAWVKEAEVTILRERYRKKGRKRKKINV